MVATSIHAGYARVVLAADGQWQVAARPDRAARPGTRRARRPTTASRAGQLRAPDGGFEQIAGFRVISYDPNVAVVSVASQRLPTDAIQVTTSTVRWADGDWKAQLEPDGGESPYATQIPDLASAGFVPFWAPR